MKKHVFLLIFAFLTLLILLAIVAAVVVHATQQQQQTQKQEQADVDEDDFANDEIENVVSSAATTDGAAPVATLDLTAKTEGDQDEDDDDDDTNEHHKSSTATTSGAKIFILGSEGGKTRELDWLFDTLAKIQALRRQVEAIKKETAAVKAASSNSKNAICYKNSTRNIIMPNDNNDGWFPDDDHIQPSSSDKTKNKLDKQANEAWEMLVLQLSALVKGQRPNSNMVETLSSPRREVAHYVEPMDDDMVELLMDR